MSFLHNAPWTPSEKVDLLVNVLKTSIPDLPFFLTQILFEKGIYPKWNDTPLPAGRSLSASQLIFEEMSRPFKPPAIYNVQPVGVPHVTALAPAAPGRRTFPEFETFQVQHQGQPSQQPQRALQPRPPRSTDSPIPITANGEGSAVIRSVAIPEPAQEAHRKKRGRPSKEEAEERDRALAAEGKVYQPKKRPAKKIRPSLESPATPRAGELAPFIAHTPPSQTLEAKEEGSSGKRRPKRAPKEEETLVQKITDARVFSPQPEAQSPSDRLLAPQRERDRDNYLNKDTTKHLAMDPKNIEEIQPQY